MPLTPAEIARQQAAAAEAQRHSEANTANDQALEAQKRGDLDTAQRLFQEALAKWDSQTIRENLANNTNKLAIEAQKRGDLEAAAREFEQALARWDHPVIRQNLESVRQQLAERQRQDQEWRDAPTVAKMHAQLQQLGQQLGTVGGSLNFDGGDAGGTTALPSGLDFVGLPTKPSAGTGGFGGGRALEGDASVVDLSGAKTLVVDPAKVKGTPATLEIGAGERLRDAPNAASPPAGDPMKDPLFAAVARDATARDLAKAQRAMAEAQSTADEALFNALFSPNDKNVELASDQAWEQLRKAEQTVRDLRTQKQTLEHEQLMADLQRIRQDPALAAQLETALQRIRQQELEALKLPSDPAHAKLALRLELKRLQDAGAFRDSTDLLARAQTDPRVRAALDHAHAAVMHDQGDVLRDSIDDVSRVVQQLKQKLPAEAPANRPATTTPTTRPQAAMPSASASRGTLRQEPAERAASAVSANAEEPRTNLIDVAAKLQASGARREALVKSGKLEGLDIFARLRALDAAGRGDGLSKDELDRQFREARERYLKDHPNAFRGGTGNQEATADELVIGGKG